MRELSNNEKDILSRLDEFDQKHLIRKISKDESFHISRISKSKNIVLKNQKGDQAVYNPKSHSFVSNLGMGTMNDEEAVSVAMEAMKGRCKHVISYKKSGELKISLSFVMDTPYIAAETVNLKTGQRTENSIIRKINCANIYVTDEFINRLINELQKILDETLREYDLDNKKLGKLALICKYFSDADRNTFNEVFSQTLKKEDFKAKYDPVYDRVEISIKGCGIIFDTFVDDITTEGFENRINEKANRFAEIYSRHKKIMECIQYARYEDADSIRIDSKYHVNANFKDYGKYSFDPSAPYKRKFKAWRKSADEKRENELKEKIEQIKSSPLFGKIIPYELLDIILHSKNELTKPATVKIMRGLQVNEYYHDADEYFAKSCSSQYRYNAIPDETVNKCFESLVDEKMIKSRTIKGEYGSFYVYSITDKGKDFVECMKASRKNEFSEALKIIKKADINETCLEAAVAMTDKPEYACAYMGQYLHLCLSCFDRITAYIDAESAVTGDESKRKSLKKLKKMISDVKKCKTDIIRQAIFI